MLLLYNTYQGSKGIRQWPINLNTTTLMKHKITLPVEYNQRQKGQYTKLDKPTNKNFKKDPKVVKPTIKKTLL